MELEPVAQMDRQDVWDVIVMTMRRCRERDPMHPGCRQQHGTGCFILELMRPDAREALQHRRYCDSCMRYPVKGTEPYACEGGSKVAEALVANGVPREAHDLLMVAQWVHDEFGDDWEGELRRLGAERGVLMPDEPQEERVH